MAMLLCWHELIGLRKRFVMNQEKSNAQYDRIIVQCKEEFIAKNKKYGNSLDVYDANDVLSKIFIKLYRIRSIQETGCYKVEGESIEKEFLGIINYCLYGIITASQIVSDVRILYEGEDLFKEYDKSVAVTRGLFQKKNHDYGEAWRQLSISFMTHECECKYNRMKKIFGDLKFKADKRQELQKEFVEVFSDICNYSIFCSILISEGVNPMI